MLAVVGVVLLAAALSGCGSDGPSITAPEAAIEADVDDVVEVFPAEAYASLSGDFGAGFAMSSTACSPPLSLEQYRLFHSRTNDLAEVLLGEETSSYRYESVNVVEFGDESARVVGEFRRLGNGNRPAAPSEPRELVMESGVWVVVNCGLVDAPIPNPLQLDPSS